MPSFDHGYFSVCSVCAREIWIGEIAYQVNNSFVCKDCYQQPVTINTLAAYNDWCREQEAQEEGV